MGIDTQSSRNGSSADHAVTPSIKSSHQPFEEVMYRKLASQLPRETTADTPVMDPVFDREGRFWKKKAKLLVGDILHHKFQSIISISMIIGLFYGLF